MKKQDNLIVSLCGGLGNQLFQIANALWLTHGQIVLEWNFGAPRLNKSGEVELRSFILPKRISTGNFPKPSKFLIKSASYLLRSRSIPQGLEKSKLFRMLVTAICTVFFSLFFKKFITLVKSSGLGIATDVINSNKSLQIGYFQSFLSTSNETVLSEMKSICLQNMSEAAKRLIDQSLLEKILIVHIRLGDYKSEENFGMPSRGYYEEAVNQALHSGDYSQIWVFSDEIALAESRLKLQTRLPIHWIGAENLSTAETFTIMRQGHGFVIANSSFSWWAARLSKFPSPFVAAPQPWFKNLKEPDNLIPPEWLRFDARFDQESKDS